MVIASVEGSSPRPRRATIFPGKLQGLHLACPGRNGVGKATALPPAEAGIRGHGGGPPRWNRCPAVCAGEDPCEDLAMGAKVLSGGIEETDHEVDLTEGRARWQAVAGAVVDDGGPEGAAGQVEGQCAGAGEQLR